MTKLDDLEAVVRLATLTESRSNAEQRALLRYATEVDNERNSGVSRNARVGPASRLADEVRATRDLDPANGDRPTDLPAKAIATWRRKIDRWRPTFAERVEADRIEGS